MDMGVQKCFQDRATLALAMGQSGPETDRGSEEARETHVQSRLLYLRL